MRILALDIGGANLKAAHTDGSVRSDAFEVWRNPGELPHAIAQHVAQMPSFDLLAVTMTAELCDCFETKKEGVFAVLDAVEATLGRRRRLPVRVWLTSGVLATLAEARAEPLKAAASNWLALATWAGRMCSAGTAILCDIGSTTSDIIPLRDGAPVPRGRTDMERLASGELVYSGVHRTPVQALLRTVKLDDRTYRVSSESFATVLDAFTWLGDLPEDPENRQTADGRPATRAGAAARLARVVCADRTMLSDHQISQIAQQVRDAQVADLLHALAQVDMSLGRRARTVITAGCGEFLAQRIVGRLHRPPRLVSIAAQMSPAVSSVACAYALATLAAERQP